MSFKNKNATISDLKEANKVVGRIKNYPNEVEYKRVGDFADIKILSVSDASYKCPKSVAGRLILLSNKDETKVAPLLWKGKSIPTTCKSAKCAETRSLDKTIDDSIYSARTVHELYMGKGDPENQIPVSVYCDNKGLIDSVNSTHQVEEKLLRPIIQYIKDTRAYMWVNELSWVDTQHCLADVLTKMNSDVRDKLMNVIKTGNMINLRKDLHPSKKAPGMTDSL